ncbi:glutamate synthase subunit beta [Amycolatopsis cihanbeyliensis]|uniref:Glutamate synthase (NADPH/NADH) small chain n=1 Tax=Amycolatopsis cihanbeyliensis TaxID=1128664 RepID=A0A542CUS6_AMYCI|nr:glutamate synthase subunit beta [Amycolatopsis cihanbeyliensis]TQI94571.1 glutamate synthase (NADPH/NADH) small chain [Amycolatopsis cihanbeyliensis]
MADPKGFLTTKRETPKSRPVDLRLMDWREVYEDFATSRLEKQAGRCMDCGIPFCHEGCPLGNLIPEWNTLVWRDDWQDAIERLHATNNFPEFTGTLCPAPCETACVLGINDDPVTIKRVEISIIDRAWEEGWVQPQLPETRTGRKVAVVGSGPSGLAAAQQLTRAGHDVVVFERADAIGGLLRYGIPEFKMEKFRLDRRLEQMRAEGTEFRAGVNVGVDITAEQLRSEYDAVVLAGGATAWRDLPITGREAEGVYQAMEYLPPANRVASGARESTPIDAKGKHVVVIGGGDTGADCVGTAHRQGAASVTQLEIMPRPPQSRAETQPWPTYPMIYRVSSAHEEGGERIYSVNTQEFLADDEGRLRALRLVEVRNEDGKFVPVEGTEQEIPAQLTLLAMGFVGPEKAGLLEDLGVELDQRGNVARNSSFQTSVDNVFVAGDMGRGQSLIVWAIAEGRSAAAGVDAYLTGRDFLPTPIAPTDRPIS